VPVNIYHYTIAFNLYIYVAKPHYSGQKNDFSVDLSYNCVPNKINVIAFNEVALANMYY